MFTTTMIQNDISRSTSTLTLAALVASVGVASAFQTSHASLHKSLRPGAVSPALRSPAFALRPTAARLRQHASVRMQSQDGPEALGPVEAIVDATETMHGAIVDATETMHEAVVQPLVEGIEEMGEFTPDPSKKDSRLWLVGAAALSGSGYAAVRVLGDSFDSPSILAIRFVIAAIVLAPWLRKCDKEVMGVALETGGWLSIGYIAQAVCLQTSNAGAAAFLASLTTVVCPVIERLTGKHLDKKAWTAMVLAVVGAFALEFGAGEMPHANDLVGLLQPLLFGMYMFRTEHALEKYPDQGMPITAVQTSVCALTSIGWWGFWQHHGIDPAATSEILAQATSPAVDAMVQVAQPAIDLLAQTQSADEASIILGAIKSGSSVVVDGASAAQSVPAAFTMSADALQAVDALMQPVAEATNSIETSRMAVPDGVVESKALVLPDGVSSALWQAKMWGASSKILALAWLGVLSSAAVLAVESIAVGKLSSSETAVVFSTEPLWAAAMGATLLGEHVGLNTAVGGAFVLAACISRVATPQELGQHWEDAVANVKAQAARQ